ncbi:mediator of RNA polymerase II transcription subunit 15a-like isoform X3 [Lycium barbarum]|uniref:mediator of RNA polymerase II transcription subunit 15a-like isoform X3 n=2 Tax=Lycium barbarum TaxID=112863 RepID=UPI00293E8654|nr:mediator of RNA polymerase II transcription subunit 15a-like isoform X3 [Lycium barbarum]
MDINTLGVEGTAAAMAVAGSSAGGFSTRAYLDSNVQMGNANAAHWQEEVYQKIKYMREMYLSVLNKLYHKIASMVQQCPQHEQIEKLKMFKMSLERIVLFLGLNKHDIQLTHKEKLFSVEKHISFFLSSNRPRESSMQLQQPQSLDGQTDPSMQPAQGSMAAMQQNHLTNLQHNSLSSISTISNSQQHMINMVQPRSIVDLGQGNSLNSLQQEYLGFLQQNSNTLQQSLPKQHEQQMQQKLFHKQQLMQQQLIAQQNQLMGQQNTMHDVQQRLVGQQKNYNSLHQQQQLLNQQNNFQNMHQQQSGSQSNIAGVQQQQSLPKPHEQQMFQYHQQQQIFRRQQLMQQQQLPGTQQPGNAGLTSNQHPINMLQQSKVPVQQQMLQSTTTLLPSQGQQAQPQPAQQQMISRSQSQPGQLQPPLGLHQQTNQLQRAMQQRLQTSAPLLQQRNVIEQQKQPNQSRRAVPAASSSDSSKGGKGKNAGSGGKSQKAKEPRPLELRVEQELPAKKICLMDSEAADILQGIQEKMVELSEDPAIKLPVSFDRGLAYAQRNKLYNDPQAIKQILKPLKVHGVSDGELCMIANFHLESVDEVFAVVPSFKPICRCPTAPTACFLFRGSCQLLERAS